MARGTCLRFLVATAMLVAEAVLATSLLALAPEPASTQFFDDRFPFQNRRQRESFDWFEPAPLERPRERAAPQQERTPADYSKAPAPKKVDPKAEAAVTTAIMVFGDSMADWLGYGLELAYAESPEIGILRKHRTNSGLIHSDDRNDAHGEYPDWPKTAREMIASQKPKFVLMMIGLNDRKQMREAAQVAPAPRVVKPAAQPADNAALELDRPAPEKPTETQTTTSSEPATSGGNRTLEFRTHAWSEPYIRRIDETIASLKTSGVPVFWVGLPPLRGPKSAADIPFLNDLYRSRADKAGIIYIDVWDGFTDEDGHYTQSGPDVEGQTRRLRTSDGVYFTQAGARKLAHNVEREIQRWTNARAAPVAIVIPEESKPEASAPAGQGGQAGSHARPLFGPTVPLIAERGTESDELLGGDARQPAADALVTKLLVRGEAVEAPAGRADDFAWPRRGIAPVGTDPVVATTDLPMTPMVASRDDTTTGFAAGSPSAKVASAQSTKPAVPRRTVRRSPAYAEAQSIYRPDYYRRFQPFGFQLFGAHW
jgi:hypothetical protein